MALSVIKLAFLKVMLWALKTEQNELKPLKNINTTLFDAILCLFCGFEARESGFLSLNFWLAQKKINRERKQGLQAETRPGCTFPEKNGIRPTRIHKQVPVTERAVCGLRLGQISVQFVREWP